MDSSYATDGSSIEAIQAIIDGLLTVDVDGNFIPALAKEKAKVSEYGSIVAKGFVPTELATGNDVELVK